ncbi:hypothetical protein DICPUDRAFT_75016 [Dictyostelium purpureum]|uniref:Uncharacterized protein n=1 Tax=Dictyostelium purpureum TaxID=5786 RepID=F0Z9E2_DICPU|nr:uncharacterized protein DICPUDRAFT_75016 [Dictyostelium purpureum]EGC39481.1 hypothetical protein DICPUDRAFT_75016 [Dictyostelium purpureum]|eukprot:XP_003284039.1 hypothetical protein DICPUDRAFT_75016 [Dictyostelium purpureum]
MKNLIEANKKTGKGHQYLKIYYSSYLKFRSNYYFNIKKEINNISTPLKSNLDQLNSISLVQNNLQPLDGFISSYDQFMKDREIAYSTYTPDSFKSFNDGDIFRDLKIEVFDYDSISARDLIGIVHLNADQVLRGQNQQNQKYMVQVHLIILVTLDGDDEKIDPNVYDYIHVVQFLTNVAFQGNEKNENLRLQLRTLEAEKERKQEKILESELVYIIDNITNPKAMMSDVYEKIYKAGCKVP